MSINMCFPVLYTERAWKHLAPSTFQIPCSNKRNQNFLEKLFDSRRGQKKHKMIPKQQMNRLTIVVNTYYRFSALKGETNYDTNCNRNKHWRYEAKWNMPVSKRQKLYGSTYMMYRNNQIHKDRGQWLSEAGGGEEGKWGATVEWVRSCSWGKRNSFEDRWWGWLHNNVNVLKAAVHLKIVKTGHLKLQIFYCNKKYSNNIKNN